MNGNINNGVWKKKQSRTNRIRPMFNLEGRRQRRTGSMRSSWAKNALRNPRNCWQTIVGLCWQAIEWCQEAMRPTAIHFQGSTRISTRENNATKNDTTDGSTMGDPLHRSLSQTHHVPSAWLLANRVQTCLNTPFDLGRQARNTSTFPVTKSICKQLPCSRSSARWTSVAFPSPAVDVPRGILFSRDKMTANRINLHPLIEHKSA